MSKFYLLLVASILFISCSSETDRVAAIETDLLPTFYVEEEKPEPATLLDRMEHYNVPGVSIAVYRNGELDWAKGYGYADVESDQPVTPSTLFQAASISKPVAALTALDMAEDGLIDIDTDVNEYLNSWQLPENDFTSEEKVTVRRLLNHTAGTTVWGFPGYSRDSELPSTVEVLSGLGNTDSVVVYKTPGEGWQYSGGGYTVMQLALSDVADRPFHEIMADRVLSPLQMNSSTYEQPLPEQHHEYAATGYRGDGTEVENKWHVYPEQAAAGLWTTPTDLGLYAVTVQNAYAGGSTPVIDQATAQEMLIPGDNNHGLGPGIELEGTHFGHGGANEGFRCNLIAAIDGNHAVVVMTNSDNGRPLVTELMQAVFRNYGWPGFEPTIKSRANLEQDYLSQFAANYRIPNVGELSIALQDSGLVVQSGQIIENPRLLIPENDSTFFDASDGSQLRFTFSDGLPVSFTVQGLTAIRIED